jgi:mono/diheme cytochrome c family protein
VICHGGAGEGASGPGLKRLAERKDASQIESAIKNRRGNMPSMYPELLKEQDVADLVAFVKTLQ